MPSWGNMSLPGRPNKAGQRLARSLQGYHSVRLPPVLLRHPACTEDFAPGPTALPCAPLYMPLSMQAAQLRQAQQQRLPRAGRSLWALPTQHAQRRRSQGGADMLPSKVWTPRCQSTPLRVPTRAVQHASAAHPCLAGRGLRCSSWAHLLRLAWSCTSWSSTRPSVAAAMSSCASCSADETALPRQRARHPRLRRAKVLSGMSPAAAPRMGAVRVHTLSAAAASTSTARGEAGTAIASCKQSELASSTSP